MSERLKIAEYFVSRYSAAAVSAIQQLQAEEAGEFIEAIEDSLSVLALRSMLPTAAARCVEAMPRASATKYLNRLSPKDAAAILRNTGEEARTALLGMLSRRQALRISITLRYQNSLVGAWMDTAAICCRADMLIAEAKKLVIDEGYIYSRVYVINEQNEALGSVSLIELLQHVDERQSVSRIMNSSIKPIYASLTLEQAVEWDEWADADILPVIDRDQKFVGIVRFVDLWGAMAESSPADPVSKPNADVLGFAEIYCLRLADMMVAALSAKRTFN